MTVAGGILIRVTIFATRTMCIHYLRRDLFVSVVSEVWRVIFVVVVAGNFVVAAGGFAFSS